MDDFFELHPLTPLFPYFQEDTETIRLGIRIAIWRSYLPYSERILNPLAASVRRMEKQLEVWAGKIDEFTATAQESNAWAGIDLRQRIDDLKIKRALVRAHLDELKAAGRDCRAGLRVDLESAWKDLEEAFQEMKL